MVATGATVVVDAPAVGAAADLDRAPSRPAAIAVQCRGHRHRAGRQSEPDAPTGQPESAAVHVPADADRANHLAVQAPSCQLAARNGIGRHIRYGKCVDGVLGEEAGIGQHMLHTNATPQ